MQSSKFDYLRFFLILQVIVGFGLAPIFLLKQVFGDVAVIVYGLTAVVIFSAMAFWLWIRDLGKTDLSAGNNSLGALCFGLIFGFIMAEIVAVILVAYP